MRRRCWSLLFLAAGAVGCHTATVPGQLDPVGAAISATAVALTASAVSRANGGCFSQCPNGTVCNEQTGLCEALPCKGLCGEGQACDAVTQRCEKRVEPKMSVAREQRLGLPGGILWPYGPDYFRPPPADGH